MRTTLTIAVAIFIIANSGCESTEAAKARGRRTAESDLRAGKAKLFWQGKPMEYHREYARLLKDKLNVTLTFEPEAWELSSQEDAFQGGYDERIMEEFSKGKVTLEMVRAE